MADPTNVSLRGIIAWANESMSTVMNLFIEAFSYLFAEKQVIVHQEYAIDSVTRSLVDENNIYTKLEYFDTIGNLRRTSVLSGGTTPKYTTRTQTEYSETLFVLAVSVYTQNYDEVTDEWVGETWVSTQYYTEE